MHRVNLLMALLRQGLRLVSGAALFGLLGLSRPSLAANDNFKTLTGHVPRLPLGLAAQGRLPAANQLRLAIGVALRDEKGLDQFLEQVYDPASTNYRRYLTPGEFASRFGPTAQDYQAVIEFARSNHLEVTATHGNRLLLDVTASVESIQRAFNVTLLSYRHPTEARDFYAPNAEPSVAARLPIADISGLNDYALPRPRNLKIMPAASASSAPRGTGSGSGGSYLGGDFRAAYFPDVTLTGAGQMLGLLEFDGFYNRDITAYETTAGLPAVPLQTVLLDGFSGTPTTGPNSGNGEVALDIEVAIAMAPGLSKILVYEAGPRGYPNDILNAMAASNQIKQLSCSWGWSGGPSTTTDAIFKLMAAQGQSFFSASGDSDAFTTGVNSANAVDDPSQPNTPSSCPFITQVGGTTLTTAGARGAWVSETVWNWGLYQGSYAGSSGGISSYYSIPSWQSNISMSANGGSATQRNIPDVAFTADNIYITCNNGSSGPVGGTSCAAPLWAALTALINQQCVAQGSASVGFVNPAIYALGKSPSYKSVFHDITTGNNKSSDSPNLFPATTGYDLCTGWGTPYGQAFINAMVGAMTLLPTGGLTFNGPAGGPFNPSAATLVLTNAGNSSFTWTLINTSAWLTLSVTNGTLAAGAAAPIVASLTAAANLAPGVYTTTLQLTNRSGGVMQYPVTLSVGQSLVQNGGFETGDFIGWTMIGHPNLPDYIYNAVENNAPGFNVNPSGLYSAFLGDSQLASLSQSFPTLPGQYYLLSLWLNNSTNTPVDQFILNWNAAGGPTSNLFTLLNPPSFDWTNLQFLVRATASNTTLQILAENDNGFFGVDDVSLTPAPKFGFQTYAKQANDFQLSWLTATGLVYQVQYRTNLSLGNWMNLGSPFIASSYSAAVVDTNAIKSSRQRFYRLVVSP